MTTKKYLEEQKRKLLKAISHLEYSHKKIQTLPEEIEKLDEETLETWESFSARFARVADIFLTKYLRAFVLLQDPGFEGSFRDFVNQAEKLGLIESVEQWMAIRELSSKFLNEFYDQNLTDFFSNLKTHTPYLLKIPKKLTHV